MLANSYVWGIFCPPSILEENEPLLRLDPE